MRRSGAISAAVLAALALGQLFAPGCDISDLTSGRTSSSSGSGGAGAGGSAGTGGTTASGGAPGTGGTTASGGGGNGGAPVDPHQPCGPLTGRFCDGHPQALLCVDFDETPEVPFADNGWIGYIHVRPAMPDSGLGTSVTRAEVGCNGKGAILYAAPNPTSSNDRYADFLYQSGATLPSKLTVQSDMRLGDAAGTSGYVTNQVCYIQFAMCQVLFRIAATGGGSSTVDNTPVTPTIDFQADLGTWHRYAFTLEPNGGNAFASVTVDGVSVLDATDTGCALGGATGVDFSAGFWLVPHDAIDHQARIDNIVVTSKP